MWTTDLRALVVVAAVGGLPSVVAVSCFPALNEIAGSGGSMSTSSGTGGLRSDGTTSSASSGSGGMNDGGPDSDAGDADAPACPANIETDQLNCGRCNHDCCGGLCVGGVCQPRLVSTGNLPGPPVVDSQYIYWPDGQTTANGSILRADKTQTGMPTMLASGLDHPSAVAVDSSFVYWVTNIYTPPTKYGGVYRVPINGGTVTTLVPANESGPTFIVLNSTNLFWDNHGSNEIRTSALDGSNPKTIASMTDMVSGPLQMAIDISWVYWADRSTTHGIRKAPVLGTGPQTLSTGTDPIGVAVNLESIFWANYADGTIQKAPLVGGPATTIASSGGRGPFSVAVDESYVYWADEGFPAGAGVNASDPNGSIRAASVNGTGAEGMILTESQNPSWLTIDAKCIYWADTKNGNISVIAKP
jgi:hypothetical protein